MEKVLIILLASVVAACAESTYSTPYAFTNFAGLPGDGACRTTTVDGPGNEARFCSPNGVAVDTAGNVYVADSGSHTIRKITLNGMVTTLAGGAGQIGREDGAGSAARFNHPTAVAVDAAGNVYVADSGNHTIRKITTAGVVTTLAGSAGKSGSDDGTGSAALFYEPRGVAVDAAGNVYVADTGNNTIRKIRLDGTVTTLAGSARQQCVSADGPGSAARFCTPYSVAVDSAGNVYVVDTLAQTIRKITPDGAVTTLAGRPGQYGNADGTGGEARFEFPNGVAADSVGNVYVASGTTIRKITPAGAVTTLAGVAGLIGIADGTGGAARLMPNGLAIDREDNVYVADGSNNAIRKIRPGGAVTTLAGSTAYRSADGTGNAAGFYAPFGVAVNNAGNVYVADTLNHTIRKITPTGEVTTLAGAAGLSGSTDGTGSAGLFHRPTGVAVDGAGVVYVADSYNSTIRKITAAGVVTTLAGTAGQDGSADGTGSAARFNYPHGVAVDSGGNVYVADSYNHTVRKITPAGEVTTFASIAGQGNGPSSVAVDGAGFVYVADYHNTVWKITPAGAVTILAGGGGCGSDDGTGSAALFGVPDEEGKGGCFGLSGPTVDSAGNVYVADSGNRTIRKITPAGVVTTIAGTPGVSGQADGTGSAARFNGPLGVAVDSAGHLYVADSSNNRITKGTPLFRFQTSPGSLTISNGLFEMRLAGPFGSNVIVESSANLQVWTPGQTNALSPDGLSVSLPFGANQRQFFRARLTP